MLSVITQLSVIVTLWLLKLRGFIPKAFNFVDHLFSVTALKTLGFGETFTK